MLPVPRQISGRRLRPTKRLLLWTRRVSQPILSSGLSASIYYVYNQDGLTLRTETDSVLGAPQSIAGSLAARGYSGSPLAFFADHAGGLHIVVSGTKDGVEGFYYVQP